MCLDVAEISCLNQQHQQASIFVPPVCQIRRSYSRLSLPCILLHCRAQWTHARRVFAFWEVCGIRFQGRTRSLRASTPSFSMPLRKLARIIYAGWKKKGNACNCILMGALLCILGHAVIIMVDTAQTIRHEMRTFLYSDSAQILFTRTAMSRDCCKGKSHATDHSNACGKYSGCCYEKAIAEK